MCSTDVLMSSNHDPVGKGSQRLMGPTKLPKLWYICWLRLSVQQITTSLSLQLNELHRATDERNSWQRGWFLPHNQYLCTFALRGSTPPLWLSQPHILVAQLQLVCRESHHGFFRSTELLRSLGWMQTIQENCCQLTLDDPRELISCRP